MAGAAQKVSCASRGVLVLVLLAAALIVGRVAAQSEQTPYADPPIESEPLEEVTVRGQRSLYALRIEVQAARERVFDVFNSINSNDRFDIHCRNRSQTGTRIPQRVCSPRYADDATSDAGKDFHLALFFDCGGQITGEACFTRSAFSRAQGAVVEVHPRGRELAAEVQRLARENPEFRRAISEYQAVERQYEDARRGEGSVIRASASVVGAAGVATPSKRATGEDAIVPPEAVELFTPEVPSNAPGEPVREGWVKLRYSTMADGTTSDVRVIDALPFDLDTSGAVAAVRAWTFVPATADGVPIDWHNNIAVIAFNRQESEGSASAAFAEAYEEVAELVSSARYERAKSRNERMHSELALGLYEMGLAQMQLAAIEHALGDFHAALDAIRRATGPAVPQLRDEELKTALEHRFALEVQLGLVVDALETYERRVEVGGLPSGDPVARQAAALEQALKAPEVSLAVQGRIDRSGQWQHALTWRTFAVGGVDGRNEAIEVECNRNKAAMPFDAEVEMTIPATWGECVLLIEGLHDTTFTLHEFRDSIG